MTFCITGATGFLGSRLLAALLRESTEPVVALARDEPGAARDRIAVAVAAAGGDPEAVHARVRTMRVDLAAPRLGLSAEEFRSLAERTTTLWHCAASIDLGARLADLTSSNVVGVQRLLEFAETGDRTMRFVHVSTAFVAGLRDGCVTEDDLDDSAGFATPYEESKFRAEVLMREWARRTGRDTVVLRPGVLIADEPVPPGAPGHTLSTLAAKITEVSKRHIPGIPARGGVQTLRFPAAPGSTLNLIQVDYAVNAMLAVVRSGRTGTFHITHPVDTPIRTLLDAVEELSPGVRIELGTDHAGSTIIERFIGRAFKAFLVYRNGARSYDRSRLIAAAPDLAAPDPIDRARLCGALRAPERPAVTENRRFHGQHV